MKNAKIFFDSIADKIYCRSESTGNTKEAIIESIDQFENFINDKEYDIENDLDENKNNILHLIAKYGFSEYYDIIRNHPKFNNIKNSKNNLDFTPYDIARSFQNFAKLIISVIEHNEIIYIPIYVSFDYYIRSCCKIEIKMKDDNLYSNTNDGYLKYFMEPFFKNNILKLEKTKDLESIKKYNNSILEYIIKEIKNIKSKYLEDIQFNNNCFSKYIFYIIKQDNILKNIFFFMLETDNTTKMSSFKMSSLILNSNSDSDSDSD